MDQASTIEIVVGAVIVNLAGEILLISSPKWQGFFVIPGGHIEYGENIEAALKRELKEEIGVVPDRLEFLSVDEAIFPQEFHRQVHFVFLNFVGFIENDSEIKICQQEFTDSKWIDPQEALEEMPLKRSVRTVLEAYVNKYLKGQFDYKVVRVGVQAIVCSKDQSEILFLRRKNVFGHNEWGLPGGHLEIDESIEECAVRELQEEAGLKAPTQDAQVVCLARAEEPEIHHRHIQIGVFIKTWAGSPQVNEPHKCSQLKFFPLKQLPAKVFSASWPVIEKFKRGVFY